MAGFPLSPQTPNANFLQAQSQPSYTVYGPMTGTASPVTLTPTSINLTGASAPSSMGYPQIGPSSVGTSAASNNSTSTVVWLAAGGTAAAALIAAAVLLKRSPTPNTPSQQSPSDHSAKLSEPPLETPPRAQRPASGPPTSVPHATLPPTPPASSAQKPPAVQPAPQAPTRPPEPPRPIAERTDLVAPEPTAENLKQEAAQLRDFHAKDSGQRAHVLVEALQSEALGAGSFCEAYALPGELSNFVLRVNRNFSGYGNETSEQKRALILQKLEDNVIVPVRYDNAMQTMLNDTHLGIPRAIIVPKDHPYASHTSVTPTQAQNFGLNRNDAANVSASLVRRCSGESPWKETCTAMGSIAPHCSQDRHHNMFLRHVRKLAQDDPSAFAHMLQQNGEGEYHFEQCDGRELLDKKVWNRFSGDYTKLVDSYTSYLQKLAALPQDQYNKMIARLDRLDKQHQHVRVDYVHAGNMSLDSDLGLFDLGFGKFEQTSALKVSESRAGDHDNFFGALINPNKESPHMYIVRDHDKAKISKSLQTIVDKMNAGLKSQSLSWTTSRNYDELKQPKQLMARFGTSFPERAFFPR